MTDLRNRTAFFTGHRNLPSADIPKIKERTKILTERLIKSGLIYFGNGGARGFDLLAANVILELKEIYPQIKLILVLPCRNQTAKWTNKADIELYNKILNKADKKRWLSETHYNGCELARNRHLIKYSSICICYLTKDIGGTAYTVKYAEKSGLTIYRV